MAPAEYADGTRPAHSRFRGRDDCYESPVIGAKLHVVHLPNMTLRANVPEHELPPIKLWQLAAYRACPLAGPGAQSHHCCSKNQVRRTRQQNRDLEWIETFPNADSRGFTCGVEG